MVRPFRHLDGGYTLIETLTALLILSIIVVSISASISFLLKSYSEFQQAAKIEGMKLMLNRSLRGVIQSIECPHWEKLNIEDQLVPGRVRVNYYEGRKEQYLEFLLAGSSLTVTSIEDDEYRQLYYFQNISGMKVETIEKHQITLGLSMDLELYDTSFSMDMYFPTRKTISPSILGDEE